MLSGPRVYLVPVPDPLEGETQPTDLLTSPVPWFKRRTEHINQLLILNYPIYIPDLDSRDPQGKL